MYRISIFVVFLFLTAQLFGQEKEIGNLESIFSLKVSYGYFTPGGDLADRYGNSFKFSGGLDYVTSKGLGYSLDGAFIFGSKVKEDVLAGLRNSDGLIIGANGLSSDIFTKMRGVKLGGTVYKIIPINSPKNGLKIGLGTGILAHFIRFVDQTNSVTQLRNEYKNGYDRLTRGMYVQEELGWAMHSKSGLSNGSIALEFVQSFTNSVRKNQFFIDIGEGKRLDLYSGIKINWKIPLKRIRKGTKIYY